MPKGKDVRIIVTLKCTECEDGAYNTSQKKGRNPITYTTIKNRRNTPQRLELKKFCPKCNRHTLHRELK